MPEENAVGWVFSYLKVNRFYYIQLKICCEKERDEKKLLKYETQTVFFLRPVDFHTSIARQYRSKYVMIKKMMCYSY